MIIRSRVSFPIRCTCESAVRQHENNQGSLLVPNRTYRRTAWMNTHAYINIGASGACITRLCPRIVTTLVARGTDPRPFVVQNCMDLSPTILTACDSTCIAQVP